MRFIEQQGWFYTSLAFRIRLTHIFIETLSYLWADRWNRIDTGVNPQAVTMTQFLSLPPVEGDPRRVPAVGAHGDLELYPCRNHDRTEWERVRTDRSNHDCWDRRMYHTCSSSNSIGCTTSRGRDNQAITLKNNKSLESTLP